MTTTLRAFAASAAAALLLSLAACSTATDQPDTTAEEIPDGQVAVAMDTACSGDEGVTLTVDATALEDADDVSATWCVLTDEAIDASEVLELAVIETEGTDEYGDQVVCRVNNVPAEDLALSAEDGSEYFEMCESMPAAFAYWSMWVQPAGGEWGYAQEGLETLQLQPGEGFALLFTLNGEPAEPSA
ncbi:hypothetical protein [Microbacterium sp. C7(2022)]|uniref:hypothetical protein n=1 Tax=Microbacterium sp. C7(2022) TaxID=2992759 RepID=UPI00237BB577|nr:hypothetical protein [Microbacterium sp. C7(2022)]MDE0546158.1 hypothetical protein [Microbacterium sp. C7(2022)]